jgi:hypothetical protein
MSWTLAMVKARVRTLLDDQSPTGPYTDDYIVPLISETYDVYNLELASTQTSWDINVVEVPGIVPGTPNLQSFQSGTGPLATLTAQPLRIDWKPAGQDASYYNLVSNYEVLPDLQPQLGMAGWEYRSDVIWLTPSSVAVDLRIRGEFGPAPLTEDESVLTSHARMGLAVSFGTAALIGTIRGNKDWQTVYGQQAMEAMDEIMSDISKDEQGQVRRIGRQTRRGGRRGSAYPNS